MRNKGIRNSYDAQRCLNLLRISIILSYRQSHAFSTRTFACDSRRHAFSATRARKSAMRIIKVCVRLCVRFVIRGKISRFTSDPDDLRVSRLSPPTSTLNELTFFVVSSSIIKRCATILRVGRTDCSLICVCEIGAIIDSHVLLQKSDAIGQYRVKKKNTIVIV